MNAPRDVLIALFDLDGTLVDSIDLIWSSYRHTALAHLSRRRALDALGANPASAIMVGDSPHDIAAGRAAGVRTAAAL